jgi:hypothetical protein
LTQISQISTDCFCYLLQLIFEIAIEIAKNLFYKDTQRLKKSDTQRVQIVLFKIDFWNCN